MADSLDGQQQFATFPLNLRGRFERVDATPTEISTRDLFRKELPVCIKVENQDPSIGFDPLMMKKHFQVIKIVSGEYPESSVFSEGICHASQTPSIGCNHFYISVNCDLTLCLSPIL